MSGPLGGDFWTHTVYKLVEITPKTLTKRRQNDVDIT